MEWKRQREDKTMGDFAGGACKKLAAEKVAHRCCKGEGLMRW
jgi:hypothetical protein